MFSLEINSLKQVSLLFLFIPPESPVENQIRAAVAGIRLGKIHRLSLILRAHFSRVFRNSSISSRPKVHCLPSKINCLKTFI